MGEQYAASNASRSEIITTMVASGDAFCRWSVEEIKALQLEEKSPENFNFFDFEFILNFDQGLDTQKKIQIFWSVRALILIIF